MLAGNMRLYADDFEEIFEEGYMYSLGVDVEYKVYPLSEAKFIFLEIEYPGSHCTKFGIPDLEQYLKDEVPEIPSLPIVPAIRLFTDSIIVCNNIINNPALHDLKLEEWFILMLHLYSKVEIATFFHPLIRQNDTFEMLIREKAKKITTVGELADACFMSPKTLTRKFKKIFNTTPKQWLLQQKKEQVLSEFILTQNRKELPEKLGFSSYSHLNYYCIRQFGKSLKEL